MFNQLETVTGLATPQNYTPIHNQFFALNESNAQNVVIGAPTHITAVTEQTSECSFKVRVEDNRQQSTNIQCFVKFSPLLDPLKHITGAYTHTDITTLPSFHPNEAIPHPKTIRPNNSSYVDALFSLLSALLKQSSDVINLIDCYGCFLGVKQGYRYMITDDIDMAHESSHFMDNLGTLFTLEGGIPYRSDSLSRKPALSIGGAVSLDCVETSSLIMELFTDISSATALPSETSIPIVLRRTSQCSSESNTSSDEETTDDEENTNDEDNANDEELTEEWKHARASVDSLESDDEHFSETERR